jgi:hypothetical protein
MELLRYSDLDARGMEEHVEHAAALLREGDFRAADARKMTGSPFYRARLNDRDRLLFRFIVHGGITHLVLLEVIRNHAYEKSRFLNGAPVDENKLERFPDTAQVPAADLLPITFINPNNQRVHLLDKILSLDDMQEAAYVHRLPLILIGSAGSGKTVLTLEKMKQMSGDVLYVTHSAYLVENARNIYYASGYENDAQNLSFLSFQEFVETIRVPSGNVVDFGTFARWFARHRQASRLSDAHQIFEEFNGVLTGSPVTTSCLSREDYLALGIRRSIFTGDQRPLVYDLFLKYLDFLSEEGLEDLNLLCFRYHEICRPSYDAIVVDEVQDLTNVQLSLVLRTLRQPEKFILCGDSNQIVHPNFFSWAALKTLFYEQRLKASGEIIRILTTNYRNAPEVTQLANRLLLIKNARFGSIDRESHYLVRPVSDHHGQVEFFADTDAVKQEFDMRTSRSTRFAVLVMRPEDKAAAARCFRTPLLFCIQEAKGLEYENIILFNFVSGSGAAFKEVVAGVDSSDLDTDLTYARAKDKTDKSLEAFKFYINALYVAITRAAKNLYIIEQDMGHRLFRLLGLVPHGRAVKLKVRDSTAEEWQAEAHRLELQGKKEQAEAIRQRILETQPVPWPVITSDGLAHLEAEALNPLSFNRQAKLLLFEYAVMYSAPHLLPKLALLKFGPALRPDSERTNIENKYSQDFQGAHPVLNQKIERYGIDFRNPLNQTPLMVAVRIGKTDLARNLVEQGASLHSRDNWGRTPLQIALRQAFISADYALSVIGNLYGLLAPSALKVRAGGRLIKLDSHCMEFFLLHSMVALFEDVVRRKVKHSHPAFETGDFLTALKPFPVNILPKHRRQRAYLSGVLSRNELHRDDAASRRLFLRVSRGFYVPNPAMEVEIENTWINICDLLHLDAMDEGADRRLIDLLAVMRHVRKQGVLEDSFRLEVSPFHRSPVARTLSGIARQVRSEDAGQEAPGEDIWEDGWNDAVGNEDKGEDNWEDARESEDSPSDPEIPGIPFVPKPETVTPDIPHDRRHEPPAPAISAIPLQEPLFREEAWIDTMTTAASSAAPAKHEPVDEPPEDLPTEISPAGLPLSAPPAPVPRAAAAFNQAEDSSSKRARATASLSSSQRVKTADEPPLPPLPDIVMPEYTLREQQLLQRFEFPHPPYPFEDGRLVAENPDRFSPALLDIVRKIAAPPIRQVVIDGQYNFMGYIAAAYILAGAGNPSLLPLLLRSTIDPDLARFHLQHDEWLEMPRLLATIAREDPASILELAAWKPLSRASRGLLLRSLSYLFSWKRVPRESVIQVLRQVFDAGIPSSDIELWDIVLSTCWTVHPREVMTPLRRQISPSVCRELAVSRSDIENINMLPIEIVIADSRSGAKDPIRGWENFVALMIDGGRSHAADDDSEKIEPVHTGPKTGRNDPCPCGSGRKYKKCCGAG